MNTLTPLFSILIFPAGLTLIVVGLFYEWIDHKLVARLQNRIGPRWFQPFADLVKLFAKEQITPRMVHMILFFSLPVVACSGALTSALYVPFFGLAPTHSFPGDLIVTLYLLSLLTLCMGLAGWNTSSRFSLVGSTRALTQLFAYEAPFLLALLHAQQRFALGKPIRRMLAVPVLGEVGAANGEVDIARRRIGFVIPDQMIPVMRNGANQLVALKPLELMQLESRRRVDELRCQRLAAGIVE